MSSLTVAWKVTLISNPRACWGKTPVFFSSSFSPLFSLQSIWVTLIKELSPRWKISSKYTYCQLKCIINFFFSTNTLGIFLDNLNLGKKILVLSMRVAEQLLQECLDFLSPPRWGKTRAFVCFLADVQHFCQYLLLWFRISFHLPSRLSKFAFPLR